MYATKNNGVIPEWRWMAGGGLALLLVLSLTACGTQNVGTLADMATHQVNGVQLAGYEVIRYNANGTADPALNGTLDLRLEGQDLVVGVHDSVFTTSVLLDVKYNAGNVHPVKADFHGLLGNDTQVLSAAFLDQTAGLAGVGETAIGTYKPGALNGDVVTVHFAPGALHTVSAVGTPYGSPLGVGTKFEHRAYTTPPIDNFTKDDSTPGEAHARWYCGWARTDGTQDGHCNVGDFTPLGLNFGKTIDTSDAMFGAAIGDYSDNGQVSIGDLTPFAINFGTVYDQYIVEGSDNHDGDPLSPIAVIPFNAAIPKSPFPNYPDLSTIMKSWTIDFTASSSFTYAELLALDTDADGLVRLWVTSGYSGPPAALGTAAYVELSVPPLLPPELEIYPDPVDSDWDIATGSGTAADPYVINFTDLPRVFSLLADNKLGAGGDPVPVTDLDWHAFPEFGADWPQAGSFQPNSFMVGYIYARDAVMTTSNFVYVEVHGGLP